MLAVLFLLINKGYKLVMGRVAKKRHVSCSKSKIGPWSIDRFYEKLKKEGVT
jgi:hypothetical protein